jgi:hypothetical protein
MMPAVHPNSIDPKAYTAMKIDVSLLEMEARKIYASIFRTSPSDIFIQRFVVLSRKMNQGAGAEELGKYYRAIQQVRDVEALEYACRVVNRLPLLNLKVRAAVYLAETLPENYHRFVNEKHNFWLALFLVALQAGRSACKFVYGWVLMIRLGVRNG